MSETVHYRGKLKKVERIGSETLEEQCKRLLNNEELKSYYESYKEMLLDYSYKSYVVYNNVLFSVDMQDIDPDENIFRSYTEDDGVINFEVRYYNGGCSFDEAIEYALERLVNKNIK